MKISNLAGAVVLALAYSQAGATLAYDQNVTNNVIFGSGVTNGSFTVDRANGVELGLRGKLRHNASGAPENTFNSNGDGSYSFAAGVAPTQVSPTAVWSFEWSINVDTSGTAGRQLNDLTYKLGIDTDTSLATSFIEFDLIHGAAVYDHSIGDNSTAQSAGVEASDAATYASLIANNNLAQNSWKPHWFNGSLDPTADATYTFYLAAFDAAGAELARTSIDIIVGNGGGTVPEPASLALAGLALAGLGLARRRRSS